MSLWHQVWQKIDRDDPYDTGWWQLVRLIRSQDDPDVWELETSTRGSVVPTTLRLTTGEVERLRDALNREMRQ